VDRPSQWGITAPGNSIRRVFSTADCESVLGCGQSG